ncbi:MAG: hypothetical protein LBV77_07040 [Candidatus Adiutrix intracellularis]|nr:hypothetical protein [Candidatus Adiutrix intracellularis]
MIINIGIRLFNTTITLEATLNVLERVIPRLTKTIKAIFRAIIPLANLPLVVVGQS